MLALIDSEWGVLLVVAAVLILFGGSKLPKFARSLGSAQSEFKKGLAEGNKPAQGSETQAPEAQTAPPASSPGTGEPTGGEGS